tara:strand:+ start:80 stop:463 length:384 start_codon:yes stop_codon:yes gene_type:complete
METLNIRQFKLINGEEVIAVLNTKNDDNYIIEGPVILMPNMLGNLQFSHWFPLSSQKVFKLYKNRIVHHVPVDEYLHETYINFVMNTKRPEYKLQTMREAVQDLVGKELDILQEDYLDEVKTKETIH